MFNTVPRHTCKIKIKSLTQQCSFEGVALSFNGGKDCTVLLHLIRAALAQRTSDDTGNDHGLHGLTTFFFPNENDFEEITQFTHQTNSDYHLHMEVLQGDFKAGLGSLLTRIPIKAILLGTRRGDPNAPGQETYCPSSPGWPPFMRINPILEWTYHDVWSFLRFARVPYCCLYDQGYTSIGSVSNTHPNIALLKSDGTYAPAHALPDARLERAGRVSSSCARSADSEDGHPDLCHSSSNTRDIRMMLKRQASQTRYVSNAAIVIIGDEILSAKVDEVNMRFLCRELRCLGVRADTAVVVRDIVRDIARAVRTLSDAYDIVITAGGLGPTPDDVTMHGIAEAFGRQLARHPELERRIRSFFGDDNITEAHLKMAEAPTGGELALIEYYYTKEGDSCSAPQRKQAPFPLVRCRNVYVLPGVPSLVVQKWQAIKQDILSKKEDALDPFHCIVLRLKINDETRVAEAMSRVVDAFGDVVSIGSYPMMEQADGCGVALSIESKNKDALERAHGMIMEDLKCNGVDIASEHRDAHSLGGGNRALRGNS